jgi:hypothetical protein
LILKVPGQVYHAVFQPSYPEWPPYEVHPFGKGIQVHYNTDVVMANQMRAAAVTWWERHCHDPQPNYGRATACMAWSHRAAHWIAHTMTSEEWVEYTAYWGYTCPLCGHGQHTIGDEYRAHMRAVEHIENEHRYG